MPNIKHKTIPLNGNFMTHDPSTIGTNFRSYINMRPTADRPKGIAGMTKVTTNALTTYLKTRNAYHFRKFQPAESHLMAQAYNTGLTASQVIQNTTAIPSVGDFSATALFTDSSGAGRGYFSPAPAGQMAYCNGVDTCLWGGSEMPIGAFVTSTAVVTDTGEPTSPKDFTERMQNTKSDSDNIATIGGGIDAYTVLMLHCDGADASTTFTDSSASAHSVTAVGNAQLDTSYKKFGTASGLFDGTGDYLTVPDHANWNFGAGDFTIDFWVRTQDINIAVCGQYVNDNNYWVVRHNGAGGKFLFHVVVGGSAIGSYFWIVDIPINQWHHIEVSRNGSTFRMFLNGTQIPTGILIDLGASAMPDLAAVLEIGAIKNHSLLTTGHLDDFRISKGIARHTSNFTVPSTPYSDAAATFLVGSSRPLQGIKPYVQSGNQITSSLSGKVWIGSTWKTLTLTDNTDTGASLATTGTVTFSSTVGTAKPKFIAGYFLYWYQFTLSAGSATIYQVTVDAPFQQLTDLWDGVYRDVSACFKRTAGYLKDVTTNALREDYDADIEETFIDLSSLGGYSDPNNCIELGFSEKICGVFFKIPKPNGNSTVMSVDYFNGKEYVSVGTITDGTASDGKSLSLSSLVTWDNSSIADETKNDSVRRGSIITKGDTVVNDPLYFYRFRWSNTLDTSVKIDYIGGITAVKTINYYKFPLFAQNRLLLGCDMAGEKNKLKVSAKRQAQVFNGQDSLDVYFGEDGELTCGVELFSQYGGNLYSMILIMKDTETWVIASQDIDTWAYNTFPLSTFIGCPAPQTLKTVALSDQAQGVGKTVAIWQGSNGIYISDGRTPIPIHGDISEYFDRNDSRCIRGSMVGDSVGWCDYHNTEYHWKFASGASAAGLNTELVYNWNLGKWYEVQRGVEIQCGVEVVDTNGNPYSYGFIDTGYMERLEYGTTFDGTAITSTLHFGDFPLDDLAYETLIETVKLLAVAKTTTSNSVTCTLYEDTSTTGAEKTMSPAKSGYHIADPYFDEQLTGNPFHSLKFVMSTNNETIGFEPLAVIVGYSLTHEQ